jgi:hypothetical protein
MDDDSLPDLKSSILGEGPEFTIGKHMALCDALIPDRLYVAVALIGAYAVPQSTQHCRHNPIFSGVVTVIDVYEDETLTGKQAGKLAQHTGPGSGWINVAQHVPETGDGVELTINLAEVFGSHGPSFDAWDAGSAHGSARLYQDQTGDATGLGDSLGARSIACADIQ